MSSKTNLKTFRPIWVLALAAGFVLYWVRPVSATTYYVNPGESIQDAIDAASYGDTIYVAAGTYVENITLKNGVALIGASESTTTLDGNDAGSVVSSYSCDPNTVLQGFAITNGNSDCGGGMYNNAGGPTVTNCTFSGNSAYAGAGMFNDVSSPTVTNCTFSGNSSDFCGGMLNDAGSPTVTDCTFSGNTTIGSGGGMANLNNSNSSPEINNCTFSDNSANDYGGGIVNLTSSPTVTNCRFSGNSASNAGGGMYNSSSSNPMVTNCTFSGNSASSGGGMFNIIGSPTLTNCTFSGNLASSGGGMRNLNSSPTVTNCMFTNNSASGGGGMSNQNSSPTLTNCTFSGNSAISGGGMQYTYSSSPTLTNCILWGDTAASDGNEIAVVISSTINVNYCDVQGGQAGIHNDGTGTVNWGSGNIDADPMFFDVNNPDPNLRDYHLRPASPCIDAGDNNSIPADTADLDGDGNTAELIPFDIDTDLRVSGGTVDMSSDEAIWDSNDNVDRGETVILNPGGGGIDPNTEALVVFENVSGPNDATIEVTEVGTDLYPDGLFRALGTTIRIDTNLADGEFFIMVSIPFDANDLAGEDPFGVDLLYWEQPPGKWRHAVRANTDPKESNPKKNRWQEEYSPDTAPTLADLKARGVGANGVFWNTETQQGFVWANVDHTTDFEGLAHNIADFEPDGDVNFVDFAWFAPNWMDTTCGVCGGADLTCDGNVNKDDLQKLCDNWLAGTEP